MAILIFSCCLPKHVLYTKLILPICLGFYNKVKPRATLLKIDSLCDCLKTNTEIFKQIETVHLVLPIFIQMLRFISVYLCSHAMPIKYTFKGSFRATVQKIVENWPQGFIQIMITQVTYDPTIQNKRIVSKQSTYSQFLGIFLRTL